MKTNFTGAITMISPSNTSLTHQNLILANEMKNGQIEKNGESPKDKVIPVKYIYNIANNQSPNRSTVIYGEDVFAYDSIVKHVNNLFDNGRKISKERYIEAQNDIYKNFEDKADKITLDFNV